MEDNRTKQELINENIELKASLARLSDKLQNITYNAEKDIEQRLANTIYHLPLAIINTDRHGYITGVNPAFLKIFDLQAADLIDKQNIKFFAPFQNTPLKQKLDSLIDEKLDFDIELPFTHNNRDTFFRCRGIMVSSKLSHGVSFILIIGDVSKRKLTEQELIKALQKAEESDKLKTAFLSSMSHEIRTPMNHIVGFTEFLKDPGLPHQEREEYAQIVSDSSQVLLKLIDDIIDIARIEAGQLLANKSIFPVNELLKGLHRSFNEMRLKRGITAVSFLLHLPDIQGITYLKSDAVRLQQILAIFLDNAFKFTAKGVIRLGYEIHQQKIVFFVKDSGEGIDPEKHELIFKRFRQLDYSSTKKYGGTGLGLAIAKGLADLLEANIILDSYPGNGSTFKIELPGLLIQKSHQQDTAFNQGALSFDWTNKTFLIVEDERTNFNLLMIMLRPSKVNIMWAQDGREAVVLMQEHKDVIDLVLMDIRLPVLNGYDATRAIKSIRPEVPVIAQTAYAMDIEVTKAIEAGCNDYVTKPIDRNLLLERIALHLSVSKGLENTP